MPIDFQVIAEQREALSQGVITTLFISSAGACFATLIGMIVTVGGFYPLMPLNWILRGYVQFFRNTPLLVQLYFFYKALPYLGLTLSPVSCGILALSLQSGAYMAEIFRSGVLSVPQEQFDSGLSLGFSRIQTYFRVVLPQATQVILPPMGNQVVSIIKNSSLVAFITVPDLFFVIYNQSASELRYLEFFTMGIALYMGLTLAASALFGWLEYLLFNSKPEQQVTYV